MDAINVIVNATYSKASWDETRLTDAIVKGVANARRSITTWISVQFIVHFGFGSVFELH